MFFWNYKTDEIDCLSAELLNCSSVTKIRIATAFFSNAGLDLLRKMKENYGLKKEEITLFLSSSFSLDQPSNLLRELVNLCETRIIFEKTFHPKVYFLEGEENKLVFGSANFTKGGLENNVEFGSIVVPDQQQVASMERFFAYCNTYSTAVGSDVITFYEKCEKDLENLRNEQLKTRNKLSGYFRQNDPFQPETYDLSRCYFEYKDYEALFPKFQEKNHEEIKKRRKEVQKKMLSIHEQIYPEIKKLGIACHKHPDHITSLIIPHPVNRNKVDWIGVRYGKTQKEIELLNESAGKENVFEFQKHGCMQYSIVENEFWITLFLAVRKEAVDRWYLQQHIDDLRPQIERELLKLKGNNMQWVVAGDERHCFDIDTRNVEEFFDYFKSFDCEGRESYLSLSYKPDDERIVTFESICDEIINKIKLLLPLYNVIVYRVKT